MSPRARLLLLALVVAVPAGGLALVLRGGGDDYPRGPMQFASSADCQPCHEDVYQEWYDSHHRISFTNPEVRKLSDDFRQKECLSCHLPRPVFHTGLGMRTLPRHSRPEEGVDCFACHLDEENRIVGRHDVPDAPCRPRRDERFLSMDLCRSCHDQHETTQQWENSPYPELGITCNTCHMPEMDRRLADGTVRVGRRHLFEGCHDEETLRDAAYMVVEVEAGKLRVTVVNDGAGHNFPTEERHRAVDITARVILEGDLPGDWERLYRFREPYLGEPGPNTQLPAMESLTVEHPLPKGPGTVEVRLLYKHNPFMADHQAVLLYEEARRIP